MTEPDCLICLKELENPVKCKHCPKAFCKICIGNWLKEAPTCPNCRTKVALTDFIKTELNEIKLFRKLSLGDIKREKPAFETFVLNNYSRTEVYTYSNFMTDHFGSRWGIYIKPRNPVFEKLTATASLFIRNGIPGRYTGEIEFVNLDPSKNKKFVIEEYFHLSEGHGTPVAFLLTQPGFLINDSITFRFSVAVANVNEEMRIQKIANARK